jgi:hypothetical protein
MIDNYKLDAALLAIGSPVVILIVPGRHLGIRRDSRGGHRSGPAALPGAVFGCLGLLRACTFPGATPRFETRRELIADETNAVGTAYLRSDLLPGAGFPLIMPVAAYLVADPQFPRSGSVPATRSTRSWSICTTPRTEAHACEP